MRADRGGPLGRYRAVKSLGRRHSPIAFKHVEFVDRLPWSRTQFSRPPAQPPPCVCHWQTGQARLPSKHGHVVNPTTSGNPCTPRNVDVVAAGHSLNKMKRCALLILPTRAPQITLCIAPRPTVTTLDWNCCTRARLRARTNTPWEERARTP